MDNFLNYVVKQITKNNKWKNLLTWSIFLTVINITVSKHDSLIDILNYKFIEMSEIHNLQLEGQ